MPYRRVADGHSADSLVSVIRRWKHLQAYSRAEMEELLIAKLIVTS